LSGEKVDKEVDCVPETAEVEIQTDEDFTNIMQQPDGQQRTDSQLGNT
jgi:hypothetical protein